MIILELEGKLVSIISNNKDYSVFNACNKILKKNYCRYNKDNKKWYISYTRVSSLIEQLEDIDILDDRIDYGKLNKLLETKPEQQVEKVRRIADYSLLNYPPIIGKSPHENFQKLGISNCINKSRYAMLIGMGSGKSYIASAIIAHRLLKYKDCGKVILLTTNIGTKNLKHELSKFIKDLDPNKVAIANKDFRDPFDHPEYDIIIASYNSFRLVCDYYKKKYKITTKTCKKPYLPLKEWAEGKELMLILDESHEVSHPESLRTKCVLLHAPLFKYRYLFTGSFADNPIKIWSQYNILDPYLNWGLSFADWKGKVALIGNHFSKFAIREWLPKELEKQNNRFINDGYGVHYTTEELINLPEFYEKKIYIPMSSIQKEIYQQVVTQDLYGKKTVQDVVNRFPFMSLACDCPFLLEKHLDKFNDDLNQLIKKFKILDIEKFEAVDDIIEDHPDEKGVIWVIHPKTIEILKERYSKYNPICIDGSIEQQERFELVEEFKKGNHKLLIANIQCLSTSVTITEATYQVYLERGYDYNSYLQSQYRIYRQGQTNRVVSYVLIYDKSIDVLLDKNLDSKGKLLEGLGSKEFISDDDWKIIFSCKEEDDLKRLY